MLFGIAYALARAPAVAAQSLWVETAKSGDVTVDVSGQGKLIPAKLTSISTASGGVVSEVHAYAGAQLRAGQPIVSLLNADLRQRLTLAEKGVAESQASLMAAQLDLLSQRLALQSKVGDLGDQLRIGALELSATSELAQRQIVSRIQLEKSKAAMVSLTRQSKDAAAQLAQLRVSQDQRSKALKLAASFGQDELKSLREQIQDLEIRAPGNGVLYELSANISEGAPVSAGTVVARISTSGQVEAELQVPSRAASSLRPGQHIQLEAAAKSFQGTITRVDPQAIQDQVRVTASVDSGQDVGLRPGVPVTGTVTVGMLRGVTYVLRPVGVRPDSTSSLFVRDTAADLLRRRDVKFGRAAGRYIEVKSGIRAGEQVVMSDMERFTDSASLRIDHE